MSIPIVVFLGERDNREDLIVRNLMYISRSIYDRLCAYMAVW